MDRIPWPAHGINVWSAPQKSDAAAVQKVQQALQEGGDTLTQMHERGLITSDVLWCVRFSLISRLTRADAGAVTIMRAILDLIPDLRLNEHGDTLAHWLLGANGGKLLAASDGVGHVALMHPLMVHATNAHGDTPLMLAAEEGHMEALAILAPLSMLAHRNIRGISAWTAQKNPEKVSDVLGVLLSALTAQDPPSDSLCRELSKALVVAVRMGDETTARRLAPFLDPSLITELHAVLGSLKDHFAAQAVARLLSLGADPNAPNPHDPERRTLTQVARAQGHGVVLGMIMEHERNKNTA